MSVFISSIKFSLSQEGDTMNSEEQEMHVIAENTGDGFYFHFNTNRWAIDDSKEVADIFKLIEDSVKVIEDRK